MSSPAMPCRYSRRAVEESPSATSPDYRMLRRGERAVTRRLHAKASAVLVFNFTKKEMLTS